MTYETSTNTLNVPDIRKLTSSIRKVATEEGLNVEFRQSSEYYIDMIVISVLQFSAESVSLFLSKVERLLKL